MPLILQMLLSLLLLNHSNHIQHILYQPWAQLGVPQAFYLFIRNKSPANTSLAALGQSLALLLREIRVLAKKLTYLDFLILEMEL